MRTHRATEPLVERRVSDSWWIVIPETLWETRNDVQAFWQGEDDHRWISTNTLLVIGPDGPVPAPLFHGQLRAMTAGIAGAQPFPEFPPGLLGWAVTAPAPGSTVAGIALSGVLVADGHALLVTIAADDLDWVRQTWLLFRFYRAGPLRAH